MKTATQKNAFVASMLEDGYDLRLRVTGVSMAPFIITGSYVTLSRTPLSELKIGDIVFCRCDDGSFKLHRLILHKKGMLITKGDALDAPDQPLTGSAYLARVQHIEQRRSDAVYSRNMELPSSQAANLLLAVYFRLKINLIRSALACKMKFESLISRRYDRPAFHFEPCEPADCALTSRS